MGQSEPTARLAAAGAARPLCVDLDGTLLATDSLHELLVGLAAQRPADLLRVPLWLAGGRARLKEQLAGRVRLDPASLPYRREVLAAIEGARAEGRPCVLVTAADRQLADAVAAHLGLFGEVLASGAGENLKGARKAARLTARFGAGGFEYLGDAGADLPVWEAAGAASLVAPAPALLRRVEARLPIARALGQRPSSGARALTAVRAMRAQQWVKNALVLLPLLASHRLAEPALWWRAACAFVAFSLCASAVYVGNDLVDLAADRAHPRKRRRPFAAGELPIAAGLVAAPLLALASAAIAALFLPPAFLGALAAYLAANVAYSLWLKRVAIADVVLLASLDVLRVVAGGIAVSVLPSPWLLAFCLFFFLNLAFLKRFVGLRRAAAESGACVAERGYEGGDLPLLASMGPAAGYLALAVLAFYVQSSNVRTLYRTPQLLWLAAPLVAYWVGRVWLLAHRGVLDDDPVAFAVRDRVTWVVAAAGVLIGCAATWL